MADRIHDLHQLLKHLAATNYPDLPTPPGTKKRASVALTIRIKPNYSHWPAEDSKAESLEDFFAQEWVQHGEAEILFIKRASRKGDRWTSHIALPGGQKDATDADDKAAAVRETWEEVGLDLEKYAVACGNLPQRLVTTHWGKKPLLVLCPYIFLLTTPAIPALRLQPTEVAATHWVPIRRLQAPEARTVAFEDVSSRLANQETGLKKWMYSCILGKMMFAGISLLPTESLHSSANGTTLDLQDNRYGPLTRWDSVRNFAIRIYRSDFFGSFPPLPPEGPLLLWGLTLGVMSDFLDLVPPHNALTLWTYPTFTPLDVRLVVWLMTYRFKARKRAELQAGMEPPGPPGMAVGNPAFGYASESIAPRYEGLNRHPYGAQDFPSRLTDSETLTDSTVVVDRPDETGFHGLGTGVVGEGKKNKKPAVSTMLEGWVERLVPYLLPEVTNRARYYDIVRRAVALALVGRATVATLVAVWVYRRWVRGRR
jgi:8-oxo-dGTP pyrophosphatase MutT (NUDIX family)